MMTYFLDSSALVKRYRREDGSDRLRDLLAAAERLIVADLARVEVSAANFAARAHGLDVVDPTSP